MKENRDNIYIYLWEELNTIYIGRTVNPKGRHYQHKHRESERTYQFSSKHHVEHPKMIIIESDLSIEEGIEREKYWINYYKENEKYALLNKSCGGQIGGQLKPLALTDEEKKERARQYKKEYNRIHKEELRIYNARHRDQRKKYYEENKEKIKESVKKYRESHKEEITKKYYENHEEKKLYNRLAFKKYYQKHLKEMREKYRERYVSNKEKKLEYNKKYREEHREEILAKKKEYRELHKEELRLKAKEYREKKKNG